MSDRYDPFEPTDPWDESHDPHAAHIDGDAYRDAFGGAFGTAGGPGAPWYPSSAGPRPHRSSEPEVDGWHDDGDVTARPTANRSRRAAGRRSARRPSAPAWTRPSASRSAPRSTGTTRSPGASHRPRHLRPGNPRKRLVAMLGVVILLFSIVVARLAQLQVDDERLIAHGERQWTQAEIVKAPRGSVFDRNGNDLAISVAQKTVVADPEVIGDPYQTAAMLAPVLGREVDDLHRQLRNESRFEYLARQVPDEVAEQVAELDLKGVFLHDEAKRFLPSGDLARSLLGAVNIDHVGLAGIEKLYDEQLTGTDGRMVFERGAKGETIAMGRREVEPARAGADLVLTIDQSLQFQAEQALKVAIDRVQAKGGMALVQNPRTGEIYAMANVSRNPDTGEAITASNNMALTTVFEPGSASKVITMAGALEEEKVGPWGSLVVPDSMQVADATFTDSHPHPTKSMSLTEIMAESSNVGTIKLGQALGKDLLDKYQRAFGFGKLTAINFPAESPGIMLPKERWSGTSLATISIGQGIAVTSLQMLQAFNAIANGGVLVEPKLVKATIDAQGVTRPTDPAAETRVVSTDTADEVREMLTAVVSGGTGSAASIDGYSVAGKTGTARKALDTGGYMDAAGNYHYVTTFAGFVPAEDPQLSIIVVLDEPTTDIYASGTAAPVFKEIGEYALRRFQIAPSPITGPTKVPPLPGKERSTDEAKVRQAPATTLPLAPDVQTDTAGTSSSTSTSTGGSSSSARPPAAGGPPTTATSTTAPGANGRSDGRPPSTTGRAAP